MIIKKSLIITGGRDYTDKDKVIKLLDKFYTYFICVGDCPTGVDRFVKDHMGNQPYSDYYFKQYKADWDKHGRAAGPLRNIEMIKENLGAVVIAFPGGKGTMNCVKEAKARGLVVLKVE